MKTLQRLKTVVAYYKRTKGVGHSSLMQTGPDFSKAPYWLIVKTISQKHMFVDHRESCRTVDCLHDPDIEGRPIVWDNFAVQDLCYEAAQEIEHLLRENAELKQKIGRAQEALK